MPILNYTTTIDANKTVAEVQRILAKYGERSILLNYGNDGSVGSLSFQIIKDDKNLGFRLPVQIDKVLAVLKRTAPYRYRTKEQAVKVSWRILKDWVEAQMAILEAEMVDIDEVFLPYLLVDGNRTLYEKMIDTKFQLKSGNEES